MTQYQSIKAEAQKKYDYYLSQHLSLDLSRGKPTSEQINVSEGLLTVLSKNEDCYGENGDYRNYGMLDGIPEARRLFSELLDVPFENVSVAGNSSLNLMYDIITTALLFGFPESQKPWSQQKIRWLCPAPGYDRHFAICESLGIEMINVPMLQDGPDMDVVEKLCQDPCVKGMWCVPKYSNPEGKTYSDRIVHRLANMQTAPDFRIFWDNAYFVHDLSDKGDQLLNLFHECEKAGNPNRPLIFASTSKITFPGGGIAAMAMSKDNLACINAHRTFQTIGPDKLNQLRHARYFKNADGIRVHMKKHAEYLRPLFDTAISALKTLPKDFVKFTEPNGGYFISINLQPGCAKRVEELMKNAGVKITPAGASFPYHKDPEDCNLRLAPTYISEEKLKICMDLLCSAIILATFEKTEISN